MSIFVEGNDYIFACYSHKNARVVIEDIEKLRWEYGVNIWHDGEMARKKGKSWLNLALAAIMRPECKGLLFFASEHSIVSWPCREEVRTASEEDKHIITIHLDPDITVKKVWNEIISKKYRNSDEYIEAKGIIEEIIRYAFPDGSNTLYFSVEERKEDEGEISQEYYYNLHENIKSECAESVILDKKNEQTGTNGTKEVTREIVDKDFKLDNEKFGSSQGYENDPPEGRSTKPVSESGIVHGYVEPSKKLKSYVSWKESRIILKGFSEPYDKISRKASDNYTELVELILNEYPGKIDEVVRELRSISTDELWEHRKDLAYYGGKPRECFLNSGIRLRIGTGINDKAKTKSINDILKIVDGGKFYSGEISFSVEEITQATPSTPEPVIEMPVAAPVHTSTSKPKKVRTQDHTPSPEGQELIRKLYNDLVVDKKIDINDKSKYGKESMAERENHNVRSDVFTNGKLSSVQITQGKGQGLYLHFVGFEIYLSVGRAGDKVKFPNDGVAIWRKGEKAQLIVKRNESKEVQQVLDNYDDEREKLFANINEYLKKYQEHTQPPSVSPPQPPMSPVEAALIGYPFELYGDSYAENNQSKAMAKIYEAVLNQHKEKLTEVEKEQNIVSFDSESKRGPKYTTVGIKVNAKDVYIDVTLDVNIKIKRILKLFEIVGDDVAEVLKVK